MARVNVAAKNAWTINPIMIGKAKKNQNISTRAGVLRKKSIKRLAESETILLRDNRNKANTKPKGRPIAKAVKKTLIVP